MQVLEPHSPESFNAFEKTCYHCKSKLLIEPGDICFKGSKWKGGGFQTECGWCGNTLGFTGAELDNLPRLYRDRLMKNAGCKSSDFTDNGGLL